MESQLIAATVRRHTQPANLKPGMFVVLRALAHSQESQPQRSMAGLAWATAHTALLWRYVQQPYNLAPTCCYVDCEQGCPGSYSSDAALPCLDVFITAKHVQPLLTLK